MRSTSALSLAILTAVALLLAGCGEGNNGDGVETFLVTARGILADANTHTPVAGAKVTIGSQPEATSNAEGLFTVAGLQPGSDLAFEATHEDYETLTGTLTLDTATRTWSLSVGEVVQVGNLVEDSPGLLSIPQAGQAGTMVVNLEPVSGNGGNGGPPDPPEFED